MARVPPAEMEKGLREAIGLVRAKAPRGQAILFTSTGRPLLPELDRALDPLAEAQARRGSQLSVSVTDFYHDMPFPTKDTAKYFTADGKGLSAAGYAFVGDCQSKYLRYIRSVGWGVDPAATADKDDCARVAKRTQRLHDAKWGVFNHYLGHGIKTKEEWTAKVDAYDVKKVADQLEACGAKFYFITLVQGRRWMCAPNTTYDRIAGTKPGEACATRDLPMELAEELGTRGIDLYLYYTGDGPYMDKQIGRRFGFTEPRFLGVTPAFVGKWASVLEEFAVRYGDRVKGWWIDGCYDGYLNYSDDLLAYYEKAVRKGNPDAAIAMNNGVFDYYARYSKHADFTAGEFNDFRVIPRSRFVGTAQAFTLIPLGKAEKEWMSWGCRGCKRDAAFVADYVSLVNRAGGVVAIDVHVNDDGSFEPDQLEVLRAVGRRTGTLK